MTTSDSLTFPPISVRKKQTPWTPRRSIFKNIFCIFVKFSAKIGSLNIQTRNNFKNIIFIACKWNKVCQYYVNSMLISCSTCQKEEKKCTWVKYLIYFFFVANLNLLLFPHFFLPNLYFQNSEFTKNGFFLVCFIKRSQIYVN